MLLPRPIHLHANLLGTIRYFPRCVDVQSTFSVYFGLAFTVIHPSREHPFRTVLCTHDYRHKRCLTVPERFLLGRTAEGSQFWLSCWSFDYTRVL